MPRDNEPWVKVKIGVRRSGKIASLPNDSARLGYFYVLLEAKVQRHMGVFDGRPHFVEVLGRFGRYLPDYIAQGLIHESSALCAECKKRFTDLAPGAVVVHDFLREQRSGRSSDEEEVPGLTGAERTKLWRLRRAVFERDNWSCRYCGRDDYERDWLVAEHVVPDGPTTMENLVTACRGCNKRKGPRTPEAAGMRLLPQPGDEHVTGHSDASPIPSDRSRVTDTGDVTRRVTSRAPESTATRTGTTTEGSTRSSTSDRARADVPVDPSDEDEEAVAWLPA